MKNAAKELRLSPTDSQRQADKVTHDLNDDDLPHKLVMTMSILSLI